jgi:dihydroflavonol-4-reductase
MTLVTGGAGLLGNELINQLLAQGKKVKAIYNKSPILNRNDIEIVQADILDIVRLQEVMEDVEEVYHCAALVSFSPKDEKKLYQINTDGTANVVNACLACNVRKLVYVSSVAALGRIREGKVVDESMVWSEETSNSEYGHSKYLAELEVWRGAAEGLQIAIVCPSIILGYADWNSGSTKLFKSIYDGFPWYSTGTSGFVDVYDVAKAMILLMESNITEEKYILSAENLSYQFILNNIAKGFNKKNPTRKVTPFLAAVTWRLEAIKSFFSNASPLITKETANTSLSSVSYDNTKLLNAFPQFKYKNIADTIAETCKKLMADQPH